MQSRHRADCRLGADIETDPRRAVDAKDVRTVGIVGCGLMGSGIVEVVAREGIDAIYLEPTDGLVEAGRARVEASTERAVDRGKMSADERDAVLARISGSTEVTAFADVDLAIEAATEDPEVKLETFRKLDEVTRDEVVLASNTSSIPIATLGAVTRRPDRVIGMHFFNPPPVMALVELTPSLTTSDETVGLVRGFAERLGKTVVVAKDEAGFIVNRLVIPYLCAAIGLLDDGFASREDIDAAMTLGMNHPMGPLRLADFIGLDTVLQIAEVLHEEFREPRYAPPAGLRRMVDSGHLGRKSGRGFYEYG
jgi:3-hydroxybutyryl-CoA dehydrogenase